MIVTLAIVLTAFAVVSFLAYKNGHDKAVKEQLKENKDAVVRKNKRGSNLRDHYDAVERLRNKYDR